MQGPALKLCFFILMSQVSLARGGNNKIINFRVPSKKHERYTKVKSTI